MANWQGNEFFEVSPGSPSEQAAQDGASIQRTLDFPMIGGIGHDDREKIRREFLGFVTYGQNADQRWILRTNPHFLPGNFLSPGPYLYAQSLVHSQMLGPAASEDAAIIGGALDDELAFYPRWRATFDYRSVPWQVLEDNDPLILPSTGPLAPTMGDPIAKPDEGDALRRGWGKTRNIVKRREPGGRVIPIRVPPFKFIGLFDITLRNIQTMEPVPLNESWETVWYRWTCPLDIYPFKQVELCMNAVNDAAFDGHAKGTLLFVSRQENIKRDPFGQWIMEVTYKLLYCPKVSRAGVPLGHNAIYYPFGTSGPGYYEVSIDGAADDTKKIYRYKDMTVLFRPRQPVDD